MDKLIAYAGKAGLSGKIRQLHNGDILNPTEKRSVLHCALRMEEVIVIL